jgi:WD40 repeat protein
MVETKTGVNEISALCYSPNAKYIGLGYPFGIKIWDAQTYLLVQEYTEKKNFRNITEAVCFSPDNKYIACGLHKKCINIYAVETKTLIRTLNGYTATISAICYSFDGEYIISGSHDGIIKIWHNNGNLIHHITAHDEGVLDLYFFPDYKIISCGHNDVIKIWNCHTGELIQTLNNIGTVTNIFCSGQNNDMIEKITNLIKLI